MTKMYIKIVEVDQPTRTVTVKYRSDNSLLDIDSYPPVAFQITNYQAKTKEEFVEQLRPQISLHLYYRDLEETPNTDVDISDWAGYTATVDPVSFPTPQPQVVEAFDTPEVEI